jgi:hypothetical protein
VCVFHCFVVERLNRSDLVVVVEVVDCSARLEMEESALV